MGEGGDEQSSSRLHRLLTLLDSGSSQETRFTAARQIGEIAKKSLPQEVASLVRKVSHHLRSKKWDTRVAAARAVGAVAEAVAESVDRASMPRIDLAKVTPPNMSFNISKVLEFGVLVASGGHEYDGASDSTNTLARQKQHLRRRLGLDLCEQFMDVSDVIADDDLAANHQPQPPVYHHHHYRLVADISRRPSPRERNLLKRKAKITSKAADASSSSSASSTILRPRITSMEAHNELLPDSNNDLHDHHSWPFQSLVDHLLLDIFDPVWEVRHGSLMALREILTHQGASAGVVPPEDEDEDDEEEEEGDGEEVKEAIKMEPEEIDLNFTQDSEPVLKRPKLEHLYSAPVPESELAHTCWLQNCQFLQDCAIRFLCVLSLDRFGDYVSDQVVAPVRETCVQALGVVFKYMHPISVHQTLNILLEMQCRPEWEIRHGSLLGIKYLVAVRKEMLEEVLGRVVAACREGLEDPDDDVRAVAADALIPTAASIVRLQSQTLNSIVMLLWDILLDLDDLSPSTSSVMNLLAEIYSQEEMIPKMLKDEQRFDLNDLESSDNTGQRLNLQENPFMLSTLAPRLWPFMRHSITSVRYSAIRTLERLLEAGYKRNSSGSTFWPAFILGDTLRIVFQNLLLDSNEEILQCSERVWRLLLQSPKEDLRIIVSSYMSSWIELASTPHGSALDPTKMFWPVSIPRKSHFRAAAKRRAVGVENESYRNIGIGSVNGGFLQEKIGEAAAEMIVGSDAARTRVVTSMALGICASKLDESCMQCVIDPLSKALTSLSGVRRQVASLVLISWFKEIQSKSTSEDQQVLPAFPCHLRNWLLDLLACADPTFPTKDSLLPYLELSRTYSKMRGEAAQLLRALQSCGMFDNLLETTNFDLESSSVDDFINLAYKVPVLSYKDVGDDLLGHLQDVESAKQRLLSTSGYLKCVQSNLHVSVCALIAAAVVWMSELPSRLNPVILPLMASIRREQEEKLQEKAAEALAELIAFCISRKPSPNDKLIKNVCSSICTDPCETPQASVISSMEIVDDQDLLSFGTATSKQRLKAGAEDRSKVEGFISRRGSELALRHLCNKFGASLFDKLPKLWYCLTEVIKPSSSESPISCEKPIRETIDSVQDPQILINNIQVVRSIAPLVHEVLKPKLLTLLPSLFYCIRHSHVAVRLASSRCVTAMAKSMKEHAMGAIIENAIQMLGDDTSISARHGAGIVISLLLQGMGVELVPYAPLLVVPLLRCMSDCDQIVRQSVTHSFAALVPLLPLARGLLPPVGLSDTFSRSAEDALFLEQLLDNSNIDDYKLSANLKVTLRRYQQEGINWLAFLKRFKLHGILCDDMGLGKTLQASAIVACNIVESRNLNNVETLPPSLIICPSTLVGHWAFEIEKYIDVSIISTLQYVGSAQERIYLREHFCKHNVIITSYDVLRKDIDYLEKPIWNYCILDEGHIIKNAKSKLTHAVKQVKAQNRLILSGTPIQNNVMDLWSLFDFLMPGFLGTERQFQATYGKPLAAARESKCSAKDAEAGVLAMEALHKQVMPFLLRRTKDEVLSDLPEKIVQDRYCDLSPVQLKLYEQFSGSRVRQEISGMVKVDSESADVSTKASSHVFQALQYLLKLCSHPLLVLGEKIPDSVASLLSGKSASSDIISELHRPCHSPKLVALQEILEECGIGDSEASDGVGQHRVLIFAQHKAFLDIIEKDLFQTHMKSVTYLRLDGSVPTERRFEIVKAFNSDPTIDALLLTTHVGGLGLNLTSADTLVFMEHDWNPMRDHQAMDRAHRLGQKKVVNVHRLIMRGTLEEKVMSLQRFKVSVANAVINAENASMKTMNTDQLLDLFASAETSKKSPGESKEAENSVDGVVIGKKGLKAVLGGLEELWDQSQYTEEYDLTQFLSKLSA